MGIVCDSRAFGFARWESGIHHSTRLCFDYATRTPIPKRQEIWVRGVPLGTQALAPRERGLPALSVEDAVCDRAISVSDGNVARLLEVLEVVKVVEVAELLEVVVRV